MIWGGNDLGVRVQILRGWRRPDLHLGLLGQVSALHQRRNRFCKPVPPRRMPPAIFTIPAISGEPAEAWNTTPGEWWTQVEYSYDFFPDFHSSITNQNHTLNPRGITFGETYRFGPSGSRY